MVASMAVSALYLATAAGTRRDLQPYTIQSSAGWYKRECTGEPDKVPCKFDKEYVTLKLGDSEFVCQHATLQEQRDTSELHYDLWEAHKIKDPPGTFVYSPWFELGTLAGVLTEVRDKTFDYLSHSYTCNPRSVHYAKLDYLSFECKIGDEYRTENDCPSSCVRLTSHEGGQCWPNLEDEHCLEDSRCISKNSTYTHHNIGEGKTLLEVQGKCVAGTTGDSTRLVACNKGDKSQHWLFKAVETLV